MWLVPAMLWVTPAAQAQSLTAGSLGGSIEDASGQRLSEADVVLRDLSTGTTRSALTRREGEFRFLLIPPGEYEVRVERLGFRPQVVPRVPVRAGATLNFVVRLDPRGEGSFGVDTVALAAAPTGGADLVLGGGGAADDFVALADPWGWLSAAAAVLPSASSALDSEGMPGRFSEMALDGVSRQAARHPRAAGSGFAAAAYPLIAIGGAELPGGGLDAEWPGLGGGLLAATSRRGASRMALEASAELGTAVQSGHVVLRGPVVRDTAHFALGAAIRRVSPELGALWPADSVADSVLVIARDSFAADLGAYRRATEPVATIGAAFGRFDWRISGSNHLALRLSAAAGTADTPEHGGQWAPVPGVSLSLWEASGAVAITSQLSGRLAQELRIGLDAGNRDYEGSVLPRVTFLEGGFGFGGGDALPGRFGRVSLHGSETVHYRAGSSELKAGLSFRTTKFDQTWAEDRGGVYLFGGWNELATRQGAFRRTTGATPFTEFSTSELALFTQFLARPSSGLELQFGLRAGREQIPVELARRDNTWQSRTGLDNTTLAEPKWTFSPRGAFQWSAGASREWRVRGEASVVHDRFDPALLAEWIGRSLGATVTRSAGSIGTWPDVPDSAAILQGNLLTLFGPDFEPTRTGRLALGITRSFGGTVLRVTGSYRHTDFLPRRRDLNLTSSPGMRDRDGRPVYGTLVQAGQLVTAQPGTNRRFTGFDAVDAMDASGASDYYGATLSLERLVSSGLSILGSYTFSRTTDNWVGAAGGTAEAQLVPFDSIAGAAWAQGTSDFDIPHRVVLGAQVQGGRFGIRLGALLRWQSGAPFTPGYRDGVDANADGSGRNDPAFVSDTLGGASDVIAANSCLASQVGRFAERNSCRAPSELRLDLRFGVRLFTAGGAVTELLIDGLGLAGTETGIVDRALYLVDAARTITTNPVNGRISVPLVANPGFGRLLWSRAPAATWRAGLRITW